jgi:hypothetical protein
MGATIRRRCVLNETPCNNVKIRYIQSVTMHRTRRPDICRNIRTWELKSLEYRLLVRPKMKWEDTNAGLIIIIIPGEIGYFILHLKCAFWTPLRLIFEIKSVCNLTGIFTPRIIFVCI